MGAGYNAFDMTLRAMRGLAQSFGPPVAGKSQRLTTDATDKTLTLEGGAVYMLTATTAAYIGLADTTQAANGALLPANVPIWIQAPSAGLVLHATQQSATGTLVAAKCDDVW